MLINCSEGQVQLKISALKLKKKLSSFAFGKTFNLKVININTNTNKYNLIVIEKIDHFDDPKVL